MMTRFADCCDAIRGLSGWVFVGVLVSFFNHTAHAQSGSINQQSVSDQRCVKGDDVRWIEIRFADEEGRLPCRVIYRPDDDSGGDLVGAVSWSDLPDYAVCEAQAFDVIDRLTDEGWACSGDVDIAAAAEDGDGPLRIQQAVLETTEGADEVSPDEPEGASPAGDGITDDGAEEPARLVDNPDIAPPADDLIKMVQDDLSRLDTTLDGQLEAEVAGYGDLNDDTIEDALVLYTYSSRQPAYRQFLAAYIFDGDTYQLTATKPIGGNFSATMDAQVETIDQGVVHLVLQAFAPGDASCCPTGTSHIALVLRDLDLVEIDADVPTR